MSFLNIESEDKTYEFLPQGSLLEIFQNHELVTESACGGKGTCGKCKVKIIDGEANDPTAEELKLLTNGELCRGIRLSCQVTPSGDMTVKLLDSKNLKHKILADGYLPEFEINPLISKKVYTITRPRSDNNSSYQELLEKILETPIPQDSHDLLRSLPKIFKGKKLTAIFTGDTLIGVEAGDTSDQTYGIAVDIGTTTVVVSLVDLNEGREIGSKTAINPQKEYGLDVLSRIDFVRRKKNGLKKLQGAILEGLNQLTSKICMENMVAVENIYEITVAANATMMHLLLGVDTASIGRTPFSTVFSKSQNLAAGILGFKASPFARLYCLPGVSSYIGADIAAGVVVSQLKETRKNILFVDIGTNCEIVLSKAGDLSACSCAAGPALEGMNISCGMRASEGAIEGVKINGNKIDIKVIGETEPAGVCGSGILEAISEILRVGLIGKTGRLKKGEEVQSDVKLQGLAQFLMEKNGKRNIILSQKPEPIVITQGDIRQVQLARGAILSGLYSLLELMEITMEDLDKVIIAGQFGKHLSVDSLVGVGILSEALRGKIDYIGNSSKTGALMCLLSRETREAMESISEKIHYFELSTKEGYEKLFTKCLTFN
ncbi:MAG: ASKHA domain-containing protein [Desulfobacterium sp.]|nr:ASKHA domain-containing protein [Desulfobacterium sp.]